MSDKGEKMCPLCTEEMDLTDQQLKPCKCGYEICVWCWHHIMDMAGKDDTEGRCPACRTPYDKEKVVGMAANCERLVAEINSERKQKFQKPKPKAFEGRKYLSSVRVIQRNLVYIIGLPLSLADEDLLWHMEYFGQYGKVLKVSISRTASGAIQHSSNNSCSVYITYSKEEEAVRCIQSVHNFVLEGRPLRACFGTTKYCHAWLRNLPCSIPDCLYLHDFGSQEDSFTKDEIVSAFTRSRVQQIVGATNNLQRRSGNVLPPPVDAYSNVNISSTAKPAVKNPSNNTGSQVRGSCPDDSTGRCIPFPASTSWVMRVSTSRPSVASLSGSSGPVKEKPDTFDSPLVLLSEVVSTRRSNHDVGNRSTIAEESCEVHPNGKLDPLELTKQYMDTDCRTALLKINAEVILDSTSTPAIITSGNHSPRLPASEDSGRDIAAPPITSSIDLNKQSCSSGPDKDGNFNLDGKVQSFCSGLLSINIHNHLEDSYSIPAVPDSSISNHLLIKPIKNQGLQPDYSKQFREPTTSLALREVAFDDQKLKGSEGICQPPSTSCSSNLLQTSNQSSCRSLQQGEVCSRSNLNAEPVMVQMKHDEAAFPCASAESVLSNGFNDNKISSFAELDGIFEYSNFFSDVEKGEHVGRFDNDAVNAENNVASDMGESNIISNIMSMDLDAWDDPLTLPHSLVKLLSETDGQHGSLKIPSLRKAQTSNQSRFSFARQENLEDQRVPNKYSAPHDFMENKDPCVEECQNIFSSSSFAGSDNFPGSHSFTSSDKPSVPRARISTPPGFSVPSREPPPGFSIHDGVYQDINRSSVIQTSSFLGGQFQAPSTGNVGSTGDVEFIDPAILEVGKGILTTGLNDTGLDMRATFRPQLSPFEHEAQLQLLMQQSIAAHQNLKFSDHFRNMFSPPNDAFGIPPMLVEQSQVSNPSPFAQLTAQQFRNAHTSNGHWNGWNEIKHAGDLGISERLTNERLGFSNFISGYDDLKFRMPGSGNIYNRGFGM